jgi:CheY-like chemotaxis protein
MKKILIVNNQEAFLDRNKTLLNRAGFVILTAASANEALQICREQTVDLIIAQLDLPGTKGDLFCSLIRKDSELRNVSIILVCYESEAEFAENCGANAVVTKPIRPELLLQLVGKFLGISARREYRAAFHAKVEGSRGSKVFSGMTRNISVSGMLCETAVLLQKDDLLSNLLFNIDSSKIVANGKVIWSARMEDEKYSYGVRFIELAPELKETIEQFVAATEQNSTGEVPSS